MAGLYIHIPFCEKKCIYCDFYSESNHNDRDTFVQFLMKEIEMNCQYFGCEEIETIYFGGGTPSLLEPKQVDKILSELIKVLKLHLKLIPAPLTNKNFQTINKLELIG
jgi:oxygen-independent coproporphyrinogen-3 oxidase